jgi:hypothetical protein
VPKTQLYVHIGSLILEQLREGAGGTGHIVRVNQVKNAFALTLFRFISDYILDGRAFVAYGSIAVQNHDDVQTPFDEWTEILFAVLQSLHPLLALRDGAGYGMRLISH